MIGRGLAGWWLGITDEQGSSGGVEQEVVVGGGAQVCQMGAAWELSAHTLGDGAGGAEELEPLEVCHRCGLHESSVGCVLRSARGGPRPALCRPMPMLMTLVRTTCIK